VAYPQGEGTWKGNFYPYGTKNELEFYSQFFNAVEINSSFYRPPSPVMAASWVKKTPDSFFFTVKFWQKFTHPKMYKEAKREAAVISTADIDLFKLLQ
jgi:uncharacterized protein YecE (DUF72 family)